MKIGYFAPLPPVRSGVADYAAALLRVLPGEAVVNGDGDVNLYQMGNNGLHAGIYRRALERPGVVLLHDAMLQHFHLGAFGREGYIAEFAYAYGDWYKTLAGDLWDGRSRSASDARYFRWPMLRRLAERSLGVVVHNRAAAEMVRREAPDVRLWVIPHLPLPASEPAPAETERWRAGHGVLASHTLFGLMGYLRESKRVAGVLRAFARVRSRRKDAWLLVAGEFASTDLERAVAPALAGEGIIREPYLSDDGLALRLAATDAGINLRWPPAGESSGLTSRWLRAGRPVFTTPGGESEELPAGACISVDAGLAEEEMLEALLQWFAESPGRRRQAARAAREWAVQAPSLQEVGRRFGEVLSAAR